MQDNLTLNILFKPEFLILKKIKLLHLYYFSTGQ